MRAYKILSAIIVAAVMLAVPMFTVLDASDAAVEERSSSVYFQSKENLSSDEIGKFVYIDVSPEAVRNYLEATADFNIGSFGFTVSDIKTSNYLVQGGVARSISDSAFMSDRFSIISMDIEFKLIADENDVSLFRGNFNGDARYGFSQSVSVKQNDEMTFKGTLKTELSHVDEQKMISSDGMYLVNERAYSVAERTVLSLDAVYRTSDGMEQTFRFDASFIGSMDDSYSVGADPNDIRTMALGDLHIHEVNQSSVGKGYVTMGYEGKEYTAESDAGRFQAVYGGMLSFHCYSGKQTDMISSSELMTADSYKGRYAEVDPRAFFTAFTGTDQELFEQIGNVGSMDLRHPEKVVNGAHDTIDDIIGLEKKDTKEQAFILVASMLIAFIVVLVAAVFVISRRKKRW